MSSNEYDELQKGTTFILIRTVVYKMSISNACLLLFIKSIATIVQNPYQ